ncbi:MAG: hypothetical protein ACLFRD_00685 [Nitriliruptoraceae bacterium]
MRRILTLLSTLLLALALAAGPAVAFEPPGDGAQDNFDCVENKDGEIDPLSPVRGHPGAAGLYENGAHERAVENSDGNSTTAWKPANDPDNPVDNRCE